MDAGGAAGALKLISRANIPMTVLAVLALAYNLDQGQKDVRTMYTGEQKQSFLALGVEALGGDETDQTVVELAVGFISPEAFIQVGKGIKTMGKNMAEVRQTSQ